MIRKWIIVVCQSCINICPTDAFPNPIKLMRELYFLPTIEHRGPVEIDLRSKIGNRIYGCETVWLFVLE